MVLIARYGEIFLKGQNRLDFERKLADNIRKMFGVRVFRKRNRLLIEDRADLRRVFGLVSYSPAVEVDLNIEAIKKKSLDLLKDRKFETFAVAAKRMGTKFELSSQQINATVGELILENLGKKVDLKNPDMTLGIEFIDGKAYIFTENVECFGGLPVGVEGKVLLLVENERSLLAGLLMMKRGCGVLPVGLNGFDISLLQEYSPTELNLRKIKSVGELEKLALPLVVGEGFQEETEMVVLEPLVGLDKDEISKKISIFRLK